MPDAPPLARLSAIALGSVQDTGVGLGSVAPGTVADSIALSDAALRQGVTQRIVRAFLVVNGVVLVTVLVMFAVDCVFLALGKMQPADRLVSTNVLMSLIGATTVQLGAIVILMGKYLFPSKG